MAIYYKFKSAKDYDSISIESHFISVAILKYKIYEKNRMSRGTDFDLVVTNAQTNEEYLDEGMLIPKNTSVLVRRVPGWPRMPIIINPVADQDKLEADTMLEDIQATKRSFSGTDSSVSKYHEDSEWDEFGDALYAIPEAVPVHSSKPVEDAPRSSKADEDNKIRALIDTPALDWQCQDADFVHRRSGGHVFGRGGLLERTTPPLGYVCHRCEVPGHFIKHCPTNGDPTFDIKRVKPPTGIPKSMLMATPDGSYALPSGAVAVLKPNRAAFENEIEGMPSSRSVGVLPPELYCPLCTAVMKDAVLTSKCCFKSFCDKCIRDNIISKSMCVCGAKSVLADDLIPNKTLRDTIIRILERSNSSGDNGRSVLQPQASKGDAVPPQKASEGGLAPPQNDETTKIQEMTETGKVINATPLDKVKVEKGALISEPTHESRSVKEPESQMSSQVADEEVQQKPVSGEIGKKKKKKTARLPSGDMQCKTPQDFGAGNYMMPVEPAVYNPYWNGMQPGIDEFGAPYVHPISYFSYGLGPGPMSFEGGFPQDPFGAQGYKMPFLPQRDLAGFAMGFNGAPPIMSRKEFEARKAAIKNKRDLERTGGSRELSGDGECGREIRGHGDVPSMYSKSKSIPVPSDNQPPRPRSERLSQDHDPEIPCTSSKRKAKYGEDYYEEQLRPQREKERQHYHRSEPSSAARLSIRPETSDPPPQPSKSSTENTVSDRKLEASVSARISFSKKQKRCSSSPSAVNGSNRQSNRRHCQRATSDGYHEVRCKNAAAAVSRNNYSYVDDHNYESSDDDPHFKRRRSQYESSPAPAMETAQHSTRGFQERRRGQGSKHR